MNTEEREKLKDQVMDMVLTGYSYRTIAHKLGIARRSIVSYVKDRRRESIDAMRVGVEDQIAEMEIGKQKRIQKLWIIVLDSSTKVGDRNRAIQLLQGEEVLDIKRRQLVGLLPQEAPQIAIQNTNVVEGVTTIADSIRRNYPEMLEKLKMNKAQVLDNKND